MASEHAIGASGVMSTDPILSAVDLWNMADGMAVPFEKFHLDPGLRIEAN